MTDDVVRWRSRSQPLLPGADVEAAIEEEGGRCWITRVVAVAFGAGLPLVVRRGPNAVIVTYGSDAVLFPGCPSTG